MNKTLKIIGKISLIALISILAIVFLAVISLNIAKHFIYSDYYDIKDDICKNPGLGDGFVCQGICAYETESKIFVSGYMKDDFASRIYITDLENNSYYVNTVKNGEAFKGHLGGISVLDDKIYLASEKTVYKVSVSEVLGAKEGDSIEIGEGIKVNNSASFIYADDKYIYVGEFHDGGKYVTNHPYETNDGFYNAIVSKYSPDDLSTPLKIYSIRDKVQGICFTPDGKVVLSTSYGLASSVYYVYDEASAVKSGETLDGADVYYLNGCIKEFKGPAMAEGLDYYDGKVITLTESASNKYIFGKFFFANKIVGLNID